MGRDDILGGGNTILPSPMAQLLEDYESTDQFKWEHGVAS